MKHLVLLLAFVASVSALCLPIKLEHVDASGQVEVYIHPNFVDRYGLRVVLDVEYKEFGNPNGPSKKVQLASTKTDTKGFYIIEGFFRPSCYAVQIHYYLRLYDDERATYVVSEAEIPREYATNGKKFEKYLNGSVEIHS